VGDGTKRPDIIALGKLQEEKAMCRTKVSQPKADPHLLAYSAERFYCSFHKKNIYVRLKHCLYCFLYIVLDTEKRVRFKLLAEIEHVCTFRAILKGATVSGD
jgi:hypothetical protein